MSTLLTKNLADSEQSPPPLEEMPITKHLIILRKHLFKIVGLILVLFFCLHLFHNCFYLLQCKRLKKLLQVLQ